MIALVVVAAFVAGMVVATVLLAVALAKDKATWRRVLKEDRQRAFAAENRVRELESEQAPVMSDDQWSAWTERNYG